MTLSWSIQRHSPTVRSCRSATAYGGNRSPTPSTETSRRSQWSGSPRNVTIWPASRCSIGRSGLTEFAVESSTVPFGPVRRVVVADAVDTLSTAAQETKSTLPSLFSRSAVRSGGVHPTRSTTTATTPLNPRVSRSGRECEFTGPAYASVPRFGVGGQELSWLLGRTLSRTTASGNSGRLEA